MIIAGAALGLLFGFVVNPALNSPRPKTFSANGISITLNNSFKQENDEAFKFSAYTKNVWVYGVRDNFADYEGIENLSVDEYAKLIADSLSHENKSEIAHDKGLTYMTYDYTNNENGMTFTYFTSFYKMDSAFWIVQFATKKETAEKYRTDIQKWAASVTFE